jgi:hypothetical protein
MSQRTEDVRTEADWMSLYYLIVERIYNPVLMK